MTPIDNVFLGVKRFQTVFEAIYTFMALEGKRIIDEKASVFGEKFSENLYDKHISYFYYEGLDYIETKKKDDSTVIICIYDEEEGIHLDIPIAMDLYTTMYNNLSIVPKIIRQLIESDYQTFISQQTEIANLKKQQEVKDELNRIKKYNDELFKLKIKYNIN